MNHWYSRYLAANIGSTAMDALTLEAEKRGFTVNLTDLDDHFDAIDVDDRRLNVGHRNGVITKIWIG